MAIDTYALCSVNDVTNFLGLQPNTDRDLMEDLINSVSALIESYCDRKFLSRSFTEYHDGENQDRLYVYQYPITSISGVWDDTSWTWGASTEVSSSNYRIHNSSRFIVFDTYYLSKDLQNVKVIYTAGYSTVPYDVKQACVQEVVRLYKRRKTIDVSAITMNDGSITIMSDDLLPTTKKMLAPYINKRLY